MTALSILIGATAAPMLVLDFLLNKHQLINADNWRRPSPGRIFIKMIGLSLTLASVAFLYWLLPLYQGEQRQIMVWLVTHFGVAFLIFAPIYIWVTDGFMPNPEDGLYSAGLLVLGRKREINLSELSAYAMGWVVKAYFLPLMLWFAHDYIVQFYGTTWKSITSSAYGGYKFTYDTIWLFDVVWGSVGYLCTFRLLGSHIRSTDPTWKGWAVCLICYFPFSTVVNNYFVQYREQNDQPWTYWLAGHHVIFAIWGLLVLVVSFLCLFTTITFGYRFSNLTNRGVITNGAFNWSKHPSYILKNLQWWMDSLPFLSSVSVSQAMRHCIMLLLFNFVYYLRAKTEEYHLEADQAYVEYRDYIAEHGLLAKARYILYSLRKNRSGSATGVTPLQPTRPLVGLMPTTPAAEDGRMIGRSAPSAPIHGPVGTTTAEPTPEGDRSRT